MRQDEKLRRARKQLNILRAKAVVAGEEDGDGPYEWTDEGLAEMRERTQAAWRTAKRIALR